MNNINKHFLNYAKGKVITKELIESFIKNNLKSINRCSYYQSIRELNTTLIDIGRSDLIVSSKKFTNTCVKEVILLDEDDVINICDTFINYVDKFIVYAIFNGILGKEYNELTNLKVSDISDDYTTIKLKNRIYHCDDYMRKILIGTINENTYDMNVRDTRYSIGVYEYNMDSKYLIKVKPTKRNSNGLNPITKMGIQIRLKKLTTQLIDTKYKDVNLTGQLLYKSHIIYKMSLEDKKWGIDNIRKFLKENNYLGDSAEIRRLYYYKYRK